MSKTAFIFPGQGSQYVGMAKDVVENSSSARLMIEEAEDILSFSISEIMFDGPLEELKLTSITQPALFLHSALLLNELQDIRPTFTAGHSLGEYTALYAAKSLSFSDALKLVRKRGEAMLAAGNELPGTMAAIIGLEAEPLEEICNKTLADEVVQCANFNSPGQIVISGSLTGVRKAMELAKEKGAKLVKELVVSGAFHSPLMVPAVNDFKEVLQNTNTNTPELKTYANVTAELVSTGEEVQELLLKQLTAPVKWEQTIRNMVRDGVEEFIEIGSGKVLQGLVKRINRDVKILGIDKFEDLTKIS
ncbi:MAG: ACP S-malonyltransferase [Ignavibacteriae bacterium]|nr:ACP S-malonyltransferase [Ignavibacteriota bacterium]